MVQLLLEKRAANLAKILAAEGRCFVGAIPREKGPGLLLLLQWLAELAGVCIYESPGKMEAGLIYQLERLILVLVQPSFQSGLQQCPVAFLLH
jgi:hypothetical protein